MALKINQRDMSKINNLFEKSFKEMELKMRDVSINNIKVKDNLKEIRRLENKKYSLDEIISDKKSELSVLKQLLLLKENKKLDFQEIASNYLTKLISIEDKMNIKIDKLEQKDYLVEKKKKIINSLVDCFNNEFNNCLSNNNIKDVNDMNKKFKKYKSHLFEEKLIKSNCDYYQNLNLNNNNNNNIFNNNNKNEFNDKTKKDKNKDFQASINRASINDANSKQNNNNNKERKDSKENNRINEANRKKNFEQKKNSVLNEIKYEPNKNLLNPRNNLKKIISQNEKDKYNRKNKENYIKFIKIILAIEKKSVIRLNKKTFNLLIDYNNRLKLNLILEKYNKIIVPKIMKIIKEASKIYNTEKENVLDDDDFLKEIERNNDEDNTGKYKIVNFEKNLNKIKEVNEKIKELEKKINDFINKIMKSNSN